MRVLLRIAVSSSVSAINARLKTIFSDGADRHVCLPYCVFCPNIRTQIYRKADIRALKIHDRLVYFQAILKANFIRTLKMM